MNRSKRPEGFRASIDFKLFPKSGAQEADNGFTIARATRFDTGEQIILKGPYGPLSQGDTIDILKAVLKKDMQYGDYYEVQLIDHSDPVTVKDIKVYLAKMPNVSEGMINDIVAAFGIETLEKLDTDPALLEDVESSSKEELKKLAKNWKQLRMKQKNLAYLADKDFTNSQSQRIVSHFREHSIKELVAENPYVLCDVKGIPFSKIDRAAMAAKIPADDPRRLAAAIESVITGAEADGHICLDMNETIRRTKEKLASRASRKAFLYAIKDGIDRGSLHADKSYDPPKIYTLENFTIETRLLNKIEELLDSKKELPEGFALSPGSPLTEEQFQASRNAFMYRLSLLTGSAGTGKTSSLLELLDQADRYGKQTLCVAPTGKAAKRMTETTGRPASTIHRAIGIKGMRPPNIETKEFFDEERIIDADFVIVDESSMVDMRIGERLLSHISEHTHVVFVGDPNQLPPVGAGSVLLDLNESGRTPTTHLNKIFRQGEDSLLVLNANRIKDGLDPYWSREEAEKAVGHKVRDDWEFIEDASAESVKSRVIELAKELSARKGLNQKDIMITASTRKATAGVHALNDAMAEEFNPGAELIRSDNEKGNLRDGDRVMNTRNIYGRKNQPDVMNGDTGKIINVAKNGSVSVDFDGIRSFVTLDPFQASGLIPAYVSTTHKLQGSEAPIVICPIVGTGGERLLSRNLVYTAWTRGKEKCIVIGDKEKISTAARTDGSSRNTTLNLKLGEKGSVEERNRILDSIRENQLARRYK